MNTSQAFRLALAGTVVEAWLLTLVAGSFYIALGLLSAVLLAIVWKLGE